jgi:integrase
MSLNCASRVGRTTVSCTYGHDDFPALICWSDPLSRIGSRVLACLTAITLLAPVQALVASPASAVAPTPGNIIVSRLGDGSSSLGSAATPVFLDEYKPDGTFVQTTALPTAVAGTQRRLTMSGSASSEGALSSGRWQARYPDRTANFGPHRRPSSARPMHRSGWPTSGQRSTETSGLTRVQGGLLSEIKEPVIRQWRSKLQDAGVGAATLAEAYRLVHSIFNTAVDDLLIRRNPCRIKAAGQDKAHQRFALTIDQVFAVADAIQLRYRLLVLLGALTSLRFGEFAALRRRDVDPDGGELRVRRSQAELQHGRTIIKDPKSERAPLGRHPGGCAPRPARPSRPVLRNRTGRPGVHRPEGWSPTATKLPPAMEEGTRDANIEEDVHFHDLRHTGNALAAATGASTKELMARMGHSSVRAALIDQHASRSRDKADRRGDQPELPDL